MLQLFGTGINDASRPSLLALLKNTILSGVLGYIALNLIGLCLRTLRYHVLIKASGENNLPSMLHLGAVTGVRNMMVDLLPARTGELAYVALLNRGYRVTASNCLSSLSIAVVFDFIALGAIVFLSGLVLVFSGKSAVWLWITFAVLLAVITIAVFGLTVILPWLSTALTRVRFDNRLVQSGISLMTQLNQSVLSCKNAGVLIPVFYLSVAIRIFKYGGLFLLFMAVATPAFPSLSEAAWEKILGALVGAEISASLPIPALMSFGTYEAGGTLAFTALGFSEADSFLTLLGVHIWSQSIDYGLGLICLLFIILLFRGTKGSKSPGTHRLSILTAALILLAGSVFLALQYRSNLKLGASKAPPIGQSVRLDSIDEIQGGLTTLKTSEIDGFIVWSSNRFGNHDILQMDLPGGEIRQLTNHPHTETWARACAMDPATS